MKRAHVEIPWGASLTLGSCGVQICAAVKANTFLVVTIASTYKNVLQQPSDHDMKECNGHMLT